MVDPEPELAPVIPPVIAPRVHVNVLGTEAVNARFGPVPLQISAVLDDVKIGPGFTVTVMLNAGPTQDPPIEVGVTA